jgi:pimeloyl-ACP methyl ester carboxylesterase
VGLAELPRLAALIARLARFPKGGGPDPRVLERRDVTGPHQVFLDEYAPRDAPASCAVLVHGMTPNGKDEPRLVHFARAAALAGIRCTIPHLPGLAACRWEPSDLDTLVAAVDDAARRGPGRPGLVGFSYGASHALLAAAHPRARSAARFVLAFGPCRSVRELHDGYRESWRDEPRDDAEWDDAIYVRLVLAHRHRELLGLSPAPCAAIDELLRRFCHTATLAEKKAAHERHLRGLDLLGTEERVADPAADEALSLAGKLGGLRCPVSLVHDRHDHVVPCAHSEHLFAELRALPGGDRHQLVLTTLLQGRAGASRPQVGELLRVFGALAPLLRAD